MQPKISNVRIQRQEEKRMMICVMIGKDTSVAQEAQRLINRNICCEFQSM